jgi:F0F1-type ATP synthase membrane subunit b/b'
VENSGFEEIMKYWRKIDQEIEDVLREARKNLGESRAILERIGARIEELKKQRS